MLGTRSRDQVKTPDLQVAARILAFIMRWLNKNGCILARPDPTPAYPVQYDSMSLGTGSVLHQLAEYEEYKSLCSLRALCGSAINSKMQFGMTTVTRRQR
ncbi:hypothetical protein CEXT_39821, partial [Caerostris extrusa]